MNIHEYQAKEILKGYGVKIQEGIVVDQVEDAISAACTNKLFTASFLIVLVTAPLTFFCIMAFP